MDYGSNTIVDTVEVDVTVQRDVVFVLHGNNNEITNKAF